MHQAGAIFSWTTASAYARFERRAENTVRRYLLINLRVRIGFMFIGQLLTWLRPTSESGIWYNPHNQSLIITAI